MSFKTDLQKYTPRKEQRECIEFISDKFENNPIVKYFLLNLPTGVGKSHLAMMICDLYKRNINKSAKIDIITNSKVLQDQYANTYSSINNLKGKSNYKCKSYDCSCEQGMEFNKLNKSSCEECPYTGSRDMYIKGNISLTNFHLFILNSMYNKLVESRNPNILIVDEAHEFDDVMSDFISIKITESIVKRFKFSKEKTIIAELKSINNIEEYIEFIKGFLVNVTNEISLRERSMKTSKHDMLQINRSLKLNKLTKKGENKEVKEMTLINDLKQYQIKMEVFLKEYKIDPNNWVLEVSYSGKTRTKELSLEPIWSYKYLHTYIFSKYDKVFFMSGTILDRELFSYLNGLDVDKTCYYSIDSPFPVSNRPIYYMPIGKMSYAAKEQTFKNYVPIIEKILKKYKNKKGIIHTNSFELANWIKESVNDPRLIFPDSSNKDMMLKLHFESDEPTVLISPSLSTGISFDNDHARFQVIAKVPYPSLASQKNKNRQKINPDWYSWRTICELMQSYGRIIRSETDYGDTIILDESFGDVMRYSSKFFPMWYQNAIQHKRIKVN